MQDNNVPRDPSEEPLFSAVLTPHRSLGWRGFIVLMGAISALSFVAGMVFFVAGAWPVVGFLGLDVLLIWLAFRANYRSAAAYEEVIVTPSVLTVRKVGHHGERREWALNPLWVRLGREVDDEFGVQKLFLDSHGRRLPIASFLAPDERASFATALAAAIGAAKRGPDRTVVP